MVAQDHAPGARAHVACDSLALVMVERDAFVVVVGNEVPNRERFLR